jgi:hypothetical protein
MHIAPKQDESLWDNVPQIEGAISFGQKETCIRHVHPPWSIFEEYFGRMQCRAVLGFAASPILLVLSITISGILCWYFVQRYENLK